MTIMRCDTVLDVQRTCRLSASNLIIKKRLVCLGSKAKNWLLSARITRNVWTSSTVSPAFSLCSGERLHLATGRCTMWYLGGIRRHVLYVVYSQLNGNQRRQVRRTGVHST